jgi:hypothetical protein
MLIESVQVSIIAHFVLMRTFKELANPEDTTASFVEAREGPKEGSSRLVWRPQPSLSGSVDGMLCPAKQAKNSVIHSAL